jgi:hypothetical protein
VIAKMTETHTFASSEELLSYILTTQDKKDILEVAEKYKETLIAEIKPTIELFEKIDGLRSKSDFPYYIFSEVFVAMYNCYKAINENDIQLLDGLLDTYSSAFEEETNILQVYFLKRMHMLTNGAMWKYPDVESRQWKVMDGIFRMFAYYTPQDIWHACACAHYNDNEPYVIIAYGDMDYEVPSYISSQWHRYNENINAKNVDVRFNSAVRSTINAYKYQVSKHTLTKKEYTKHVAYIIESVKEGNPFFQLLAKHMIETLINPSPVEAELINTVLQYGTIDMLKYMFITKIPDNALTLLQSNTNVNAENMKDALSFLLMNASTPIAQRNAESPWSDGDYDKMVAIATETKNGKTPEKQIGK